MKRTAKITLAIICLACLGAFVAWDIKVANEAKQITAYNNPNIAAVRAALARNPNDAAAHSSMARIDILRHDLTGEVAEWRQVVRLEPDNREAQFMLAHALAQTGHRAEAKQNLQQLAKQDDTLGRAARRNLAQLDSRPPGINP